jgi:hypothetical protein
MSDKNSSKGQSNKGSQGNQAQNQANIIRQTGRIKNDDRGNSNIVPDKKSVDPSNTSKKG